MAQGQDKIAQSLLDLEPTAIVELFQLYFDTVDKEDSYIAFHGGSVFQRGIVWQGITYLPIPVETEGFEVNANGELARPKIRVANKDYFVTDLLINNNDLQFAKLIRKRTFVKYLDDINFDGGNPWSQADASAEISKDTFVISQKTAENKAFVEFELTSPLDLENFEINNRLIMSRYCPWYYRGNGCNYKGIPIETEDGRSLQVLNPATWNSSQEWKINTPYLSGQATYLENKKITIAKPYPADDNVSEFAKIWYVCQQNHTSELDKKPDTNENFWLRDGCNKKLDGCRKRFGVGLVEFNEKVESRTASFVDFTSRAGTLRYNNIAPNALASGATFASGFEASKAIDSIASSTSEWRSNSVSTTGMMLTLEWSEPKTISRVNIYDRSDTKANFRNAYIRYFNTSNTLVASGLLRNIPDNGSITGSGFSPLTGIKRIVISGSGSVGSSVGLSEVAVFEDKSPYLTYLDSGTTKLHQNDFFQISTQIALSDRVLAPNDLYSVFHNIGALQGSRYSGINLYLSGNRMNLDFATRRTGQGVAIASTNRTISIPWNNDQLRPIHIICAGGLATGTSPTGATDGYIRLTDGTILNNAQYILSSQSGEYFKFKNTSYQGGIDTGQSGLKFGLNDWQFPTGTTSSVAVPPANNPSQITNFIKVHSPIKYARMAIWTGLRGVDSRIAQYSETDFLYKRYEEISFKPEITGGLLGWWDMDVSSDGTIETENISTNKLKVVTGDYNYTGFESSTTKDIRTKTSTVVLKQNNALPFGGFPGTEQYG
jgi:lambda family phage minor tail protein L